MELTKKQLDYIKGKISRVRQLEWILSKEFSDADVSIVRGYDPASQETYTKNAFFNENKAKKFMSEIVSDGTGIYPDKFHVVTGTIEDLETDSILDKKTSEPLCYLDRIMVFESLFDHLESGLE